MLHHYEFSSQAMSLLTQTPQVLDREYSLFNSDEAVPPLDMLA